MYFFIARKIAQTLKNKNKSIINFFLPFISTQTEQSRFSISCHNLDLKKKEKNNQQPKIMNEIKKQF